MPPLREMQAAFGDALLGGPVEPAVVHIVGDGLTPEARVEIYRHHVFTTLTAALQATFPVVCRLVHERFFGYAADQYIRAHPPTGPCLFEYGGSFPAFLAGFEPCRPLPYLPDVAQLEWALNVATHADEMIPLDLAEISRLPVEDLPRLTLRLDPSLSLLTSTWPIAQIWRANQPDADPNTRVDLASGGVSLEVRRLGDDAVFHPLDPPTHAFRSALSRHCCLAEATGAAFESDNAFELPQALRDLFAEGLAVDCGMSSVDPTP
jgi:Putative DNA-binding domain